MYKKHAEPLPEDAAERLEHWGVKQTIEGKRKSRISKTFLARIVLVSSNMRKVVDGWGEFAARTRTEAVETASSDFSLWHRASTARFQQLDIDVRSRETFYRLKKYISKTRTIIEYLCEI